MTLWLSYWPTLPTMCAEEIIIPEAIGLLLTISTMAMSNLGWEILDQEAPVSHFSSIDLVKGA